MKRILVYSLACFATATFAQQGALSTLKFDPPVPKAGQEVKITVGVDGEPPSFCGLVVYFGDGSDTKYKIDSQENKLPLTISKVYPNPGVYKVKAEGRKVTTHFPCVGVVEQQLTVTATTSAVKESVCPENYSLKGKIGKAGDFSCAANKGAIKPEKILNCNDGLEYYQTKTSLGCRKARK